MLHLCASDVIVELRLPELVKKGSSPALPEEDGNSEESMTILDDATHVMEWTAINMNGETLVSGKLTFKPVDISDFRYEYEVVANLVVPDWVGGTFYGTILFIAESES